MHKSSKFEDTIWRILSFFLILCWVITIFHNYNRGLLHLVLVPSILSIGLSIYAIIKPKSLWVFAVFATFWGLMYIYTSGSITGLLLFFLGICFDIKCGFFKKFLILKVIFLALCFGFTLYHVYTIDKKILLDTVLDSVVIVLIIIMLFLLYYKEIGQFYKTILEKDNSSLTDIFSDQEIAYIKLLVQDNKHFSIAQAFNVSESSVKRTFSKMYAKLDVKGKTEFLEEIKKIATPEEKELLKLDEYSILKKD